MSSWLADKWANAPAGWGRAAIAGIQSADDNRYRQLSHGVAKQNAATAATNAVTSAGSLALREKIEPRKLDQTDTGQVLEYGRLRQQQVQHQYTISNDQRKALRERLSALGPKFTPEDRNAAEEAANADDWAKVAEIVKAAPSRYAAMRASEEGRVRGAGAAATQAQRIAAEKKLADMTEAGRVRAANPDWVGPLPIPGAVTYGPGEIPPKPSGSRKDPAQATLDNVRKQLYKALPSDQNNWDAEHFDLLEVAGSDDINAIQAAIRAYVAKNRALIDATSGGGKSKFE